MKEKEPTLNLTNFIEKYVPDWELLLVKKKDVEKVKFYIKTLHSGGSHDVEEFYNRTVK